MSKTSITIKLVKSAIGILPEHKLTLQSLGLRRIGQSTTQLNTPAVWGKIKQVGYLLAIEKGNK